MFGIALDGNDVDGFRFVRVNVNREAEVGRQIAADLAPLFAGVVGAQHVPVFLHEQHVRARWVHGNAMDTVSDFDIRVGKFVLRLQAAVHRFPGFAAVIGAEGARRRDGDVNPARIFRIEKDRMHGHAARSGLPQVTLGAAQSGKLLPRFAAVRRLENRRVLDSGVNRVRIRVRRFEMPDAFEFPRMLRAVVPLVSAHVALIHKFVAFAFGRAIGAGQLLGAAAGCLPGLAAIVGALDYLAEPTARLRRVDAVRLSGRAFEVIHFPAREVRPADFPILALAVRRQDERALLCAD